MRVSVPFHVTPEERRAIAHTLDGQTWNGKRMASKSEIEGVILDGAEDSLVTAISHGFALIESDKTRGIV